jgi:hypothetical protein
VNRLGDLVLIALACILIACMTVIMVSLTVFIGVLAWRELMGGCS